MTRGVFVAVLFALLTARTASAQWVINDPSNIAQHGIIASTMQMIVDVSTAIQTSLRRMGRSLWLFEDLSRYHADDQPLWRTRRVEIALPATVSFMDALNAGDAEGSGIDQALVTRLAMDSASDVPIAMRNDLATLDMADSALKSAIDTTGRIRGNRKAELNAMMAQVAHLNNSSTSATGVLEKLSGSAVIHAHQNRTRMELAGSIVELQLVESERDRQAENDALRRRLGSLDAPADQMAGADADLRNWRQP